MLLRGAGGRSEGARRRKITVISCVTSTVARMFRRHFQVPMIPNRDLYSVRFSEGKKSSDRGPNPLGKVPMLVTGETHDR
jgi:hypothetical protein